jgi:D-glycero-D-manno-heptose 1,7-bisphosphate phosphatase
VYYCPHHPSRGSCLCRKPGSLLLERAIARHTIDPTRSVMIGDRERDMEAAAAVGVRGIRVGSNAPLWPVVLNDVLNG